MVVYQTTSPSLRAACTIFGSEASCAWTKVGHTAAINHTRNSFARIRLMECFSLNELLWPASVDRHIDPVSVGVLNSVVGILVGLRIDLRVESRCLQSTSDVVKIVKLGTATTDGLLLIN